MISEDIIDEVISYSGKQFEKALKADKTIELSGFGKLVFRDKKAKIELNKLEKLYANYEASLIQTIDEKKRNNLTKRMLSCKEVIDFLKTKIYEQA